MPASPPIQLLPRPRFLRRGKRWFLLPRQRPLASIQELRTPSAPAHPEGYRLIIEPTGARIEFRTTAGLRAARATLRQLMQTHGRRLPCLRIRDWPDFDRRGVLLDVSRGRVPNLATLLDLAGHLADYKINELQLYFEHTFAYSRHPRVWRGWGALTGADIRVLDTRCRELGIDLVPNQNSFGHLRHFLADPALRPLAEISEPYEDDSGEFVRHPSTLAPNHPGALPFLRGLYDELLPHFSSGFFNVGGDEPWDLGRGRSRAACRRAGPGRVYLAFLKKLHREAARRGKHMMFWGDIVLKHPGLIPALPRPVTALNWGYEADHPFERETAAFARAGIPFYVCPGTSTWQTLIGRHDNALANLAAAARAGRRSGAAGFLNADWGDGGHPQPLAVSWPLYLAGAALAWNGRGFDPQSLAPVLSRGVFADASGRLAAAALGLGFAHQKFGVTAPNETPLGSVIAAPRPGSRELFCRHGLRWHTRIPAARVTDALREIERQRARLRQARPRTRAASLLRRELDLAARMAAESCHYLRWQQAVAAGQPRAAVRLARRGLRALRRLDQDFRRAWPLRNKGTARHCIPFLAWRVQEYQAGLAARPGRNAVKDA